jgi:hypothetical protein
VPALEAELTRVIDDDVDPTVASRAKVTNAIMFSRLVTSNARCSAWPPRRESRKCSSPRGGAARPEHDARAACDGLLTLEDMSETR